MAFAWMNIVIDIEPRSRYSILPDVAHMIVSGQTTGEGPLGGFSPTSIQDVYPTPSAVDGRRHTLHFSVPPAGVDVIKGGAMNVTVLFPQNGTDYTVSVQPSDEGPSPDIIDVGDRKAAVWRLEQDPDLDIDYVYDLIPHEE